MTTSTNSKIAGYLGELDSTTITGRSDSSTTTRAIRPIRDFEHNIALIIEAVEKLGYAWGVSLSNIKKPEYRYMASVYDNEHTYQEQASTPASAICEALIRAMESK